MNASVLKSYLIKFLFLTIGPLVAAVGLEGFLIPNSMIDGGIIGISIMASYVTKVNLGIYILALNFPFLFMAYKKMGAMFVIQTAYATSVLSLGVNLMHYHQATNDLLLATIFGGIILGIGVGLVLRNSAAMDGTEILALRINKKLGFSVGEIIMFFNIFIYTAAGFLYGVDRAMYSILAYFIAYKMIDVVVEGVADAKSVNIVSDKSKAIGDALINTMGLGVTYIKAKGGYSGAEKNITYCVVSRLELAQLKQTVHSIDKSAFISVVNVHEVEGTRIKQRDLIDKRLIRRIFKSQKKKKTK